MVFACRKSLKSKDGDDSNQDNDDQVTLAAVDRDEALTGRGALMFALKSENGNDY
jgi:hypothetical protein